jgi:hypothetical protein
VWQLTIQIVWRENLPLSVANPACLLFLQGNCLFKPHFPHCIQSITCWASERAEQTHNLRNMYKLPNKTDTRHTTERRERERERRCVTCLTADPIRQLAREGCQIARSIISILRRIPFSIKSAFIFKSILTISYVSLFFATIHLLAARKVELQFQLLLVFLTTPHAVSYRGVNIPIHHHRFRDLSLVTAPDAYGRRRRRSNMILARKMLLWKLCSLKTLLFVWSRSGWSSRGELVHWSWARILVGVRPVVSVGKCL